MPGAGNCGRVSIKRPEKVQAPKQGSNARKVQVPEGSKASTA